MQQRQQLIAFYVIVKTGLLKNKKKIVKEFRIKNADKDIINAFKCLLKNAYETSNEYK